jgi:hypothetical protein
MAGQHEGDVPFEITLWSRPIDLERSILIG